MLPCPSELCDPNWDSIFSLICYNVLGIRTKVIYPEPEKLKTVFMLTGVEPEHYKLYETLSLSEETRVTTEHIKVKHHDVMVNSYGVLLNIQGRNKPIMPS